MFPISDPTVHTLTFRHPGPLDVAWCLSCTRFVWADELPHRGRVLRLPPPPQEEIAA